MVKHYELYTDGACQPNPGTGGWAFAIYERGLARDRITKSGRQENTTNNRMELQAVVEGFEHFLTNCVGTLHLFSDSQYLVNGIEKWCDGWASRGWVKKDNKPVLNRDLWERIYKLKNNMALKCTFVRGHTGNHFNELCDELAVKAIDV
ncbi:unnamed protein product [marine sediment metagenome]|uniref:ribonuclease H n=1 Tax=marine sediment metagenome TaxID=412755 RepID=X0V7P4_9ZZZZ